MAATATDRTLEVCSLRGGLPWPPEPGTCAWCADPLPKRRRRWCSDECSHVFTENHAWQVVRAAALRRDRHRCRRCGHDETAHRAELDATVAAVLSLGVVLMGRRVAPAVVRAMYDARARLVVERRLEVNHITPILGRHGEFGCHHHLDGVETLCRPCHLDETARQFGHRRAGVPAGQESLDLR